MFREVLIFRSLQDRGHSSRRRDRQQACFTRKNLNALPLPGSSRVKIYGQFPFGVWETARLVFQGRGFQGKRVPTSQDQRALLGKLSLLKLIIPPMPENSRTVLSAPVAQRRQSACFTRNLGVFNSEDGVPYSENRRAQLGNQRVLPGIPECRTRNPGVPYSSKRRAQLGIIACLTRKTGVPKSDERRALPGKSARECAINTFINNT